MEPKYSVLLCNKNLAEYEQKIPAWLSEGIKVIWFSTDSSQVASLNNRYRSFAKAYLFLAYVVNFGETAFIIDGIDPTGFVGRVLAVKCPLFNSAQYQVEHCVPDEHIVVQASAGTGKTTVMIDRIMFLLHTMPELRLSEVFMITFTNDAADQMNRRLQDALMTRFRLTRKQKYLRWVEEQSQMQISTIHSFAYGLLKEFGIGEGFTKELAIRSFQFEKNELIKDALDEKVDDKNSIQRQLGVPFYRANSIVGDFWRGFSKLGIAHSELDHMDWGNPLDGNSANFQKIMSEFVKKLDDKYFDIKRKNDAVSVDDIMRDLQWVLTSGFVPETDISMKYLFIDEFQDSDLSQIRVACQLVKRLGASLFVVGDVKQSIYRFRGATDQAFFVLHKYMNEMGIKAPREFILVNNYRTSANIMTKMDNCFRCWGYEGFLQYDKPVIPFNQSNGRIEFIPSVGKYQEDDQIAQIVGGELNALIRKVRDEGIVPDEKTRVVVLTRSNPDLNKVADILRRNRIPARIKRDGSFYTSEAVKDFYMMVSSFLFSDEPSYIFNFLLTPYAGEITPMNINDMEYLNGNYEHLCEYLDHFLDETDWKKYHKELRLRPILSVFKEMLDNIPVVENFILNSKARMREEGWEEDRCNAATFSAARQYQANLEKLMELLQRNFGSDKVSLYSVYNFLKLNIATNRSEGEADVESTDDYTSVLCMTVHKSKGLEFDTVIIPYTGKMFPAWDQTEIVIDPISQRVGWNYTGDKEKKTRRYTYPPMGNDLYRELKNISNTSTEREETRILYVAMTRAINNLICIVSNTNKKNTWAYLLESSGEL